MELTPAEAYENYVCLKCQRTMWECDCSLYEASMNAYCDTECGSTETPCACGKPASTEHACWACHDTGWAADDSVSLCGWCESEDATPYDR